jgi:hypothetical protein
LKARRTPEEKCSPGDAGLEKFHFVQAGQMSQIYFPRYFDGLQIRSSRSASLFLRTLCRCLCFTAFAIVLGREQTRLISRLTDRQMSFNIFISE